MKEYYKKEFLESIVQKCSSFAEVLREIGLADKGSNFKTLQKYINKYNIDVSHLTGRTWNKGLSYTNKASYVKLEDILKENTHFKSHILKLRLVAEGLKEYKCEQCGCNGEWCGKPITLELHHINGNHYDNRLENLQILCPNCHSQSPTHKRRKYKDAEIPKPIDRKKYECVCDFCGKKFNSDRERRFCSRECYIKFLENNKTEVQLNEETLKQSITKAKSIKELANMFKTSRPTIRKYLEKYNLLDTFKQHYAETLHNKPIMQYEMDMTPIKQWGSISDAEETLGITSIGKCASFQRKSAGGFIWRYVNEENNS